MKNTTTAQKMKFSIWDFFSKYDQIRRKLRIWSHLLKKSLIENFFVQCAEFLGLASYQLKLHWNKQNVIRNANIRYLMKVVYLKLTA